MGMAAILVMWPGPFEQIFVPLSHGDSIWNLDSIGPVVSEKKMFKECGRRTDRRRTTEAYLSYKLTNEPSTQSHFPREFDKTLWHRDGTLDALDWSSRRNSV